MWLARFVGTIALLSASVVHAVLITATITVQGASGSIQFPTGRIVSFTNLPVTFTSWSATSEVFEGAGEWAFEAPITVTVPDIISVTADVPSPHVSVASWDGITPFVEFQLGTKHFDVYDLKGPVAEDSALLNYDFSHAFGPQRLANALIGSYGNPGGVTPMVINAVDGSVISVFAQHTFADFSVDIGSVASPPVPLTGVTAVAAGVAHTCAVTSAGFVKCWGLGGEVGDNTERDRFAAVNVAGPLSGVIAIAAGDFHTCAVTNALTAQCWGWNSYGQLGSPTQYVSRLTPTDVDGLSGVVTAIAGGSNHTCALTSIGGVKCWGDNSKGQLGDGTTTQRLTTVDTVGLSTGVAKITAGGFHTCAITNAGGVKCWGSNSNGELGDDTNTQRLTPVDVTALSSGITATAAGAAHTCAVISGGGVKCWGDNSNGQLGDNTTTSRVIPVDVSGLSSGVTRIATGNSHTCALTNAGGVKCWGSNQWGQLGDGSTTPRLTPVDASGLTAGVMDITAGGSHTCAVTTSGAAKCWGLNGNGQAGDRTGVNYKTAINVVLPDPPAVANIVSRKTHGAAGIFDLPLAVTTVDPTTEPRSSDNSGAHRIVFAFDKAVSSGSAAVMPPSIAASSVFSGREMIVNLGGVPDGQYVTVTVNDVASPDGGAGGSASVRIGFLAGDANTNRNVTLSDLLWTNAVLAQPVTIANYLRDVNISGTLTLSDLLYVNGHLTHTLPSP